MQFWDHERNASEGLDPAQITLGSRKKVHWVCPGCPLGVPHRWRASPNHRFSQKRKISGCPCCCGQQTCQCNSLQTLHPELAATWDYSKNHNTPVDVTAHSTQAVWWVTDQRGSWQQRIHCRTDKHHRKHWKQHADTVASIVFDQ